MRTLSLLLAALVVTAPRLGAQDSTARAAALPAAPAFRQLFTIQPISTVAGIISADYEHAVGAGPVSLGIGLSYFDDNTLGSEFESDGSSASYASIEGKARYYVSGAALRGFSLGLTLGGTHAHLHDGFSGGDGTLNGLKVGTELDYTWLLGRRRRFAVAAGIGAKRIFYGARVDGYDTGLVTTAYPTVRLAIGAAF